MFISFLINKCKITHCELNWYKTFLFAFKCKFICICPQVCLLYMLEHIQGVQSSPSDSESPMKVYWLHIQQENEGQHFFMVRWDFTFNGLTLPDIKEAIQLSQICPNHPMYDFVRLSVTHHVYVWKSVFALKNGRYVPLLYPSWNVPDAH